MLINMTQEELDALINASCHCSGAGAFTNAEQNLFLELCNALADAGRTVAASKINEATSSIVEINDKLEQANKEIEKGGQQMSKAAQAIKDAAILLSAIETIVRALARFA